MEGQMIAPGLAAAAALAVFLVVVGIERLLARDVAVSERLAQYTVRSPSERGPEANRQGPIGAGLERAVAGRSFSAGIAADLARADLKFTVSEFMMINALCVIVPAALVIVFTQNLIGGLLLGIVGSALPKIYVGYRQGARLAAFNSQLSDTCTLLANSLRSGYSMLQSMEMVAREGPSPTAEEFRRVVREVGLGLSPEQALANLVRRIQSEDLDLVVTAINVQHEVGGNLAQILDSIGNTIRERVKVKGEIKTLTSQVTCSGNAVAVMPVALTVVIFLINPEYMSQIFQPGWVLCLPATGAAGIILGWLVMRKIASIEV